MRNAVPVFSWRKKNRADLLAIVEYIADDNPDTAQELKDEIETKAAALARFPQMYKPGRVASTREMVIRENYIAVALIVKLHGERADWTSGQRDCYS
jgi:plasmid stabilization system protein ParE